MHCTMNVNFGSIFVTSVFKSSEISYKHFTVYTLTWRLFYTLGSSTFSQYKASVSMPIRSALSWEFYVAQNCNSVPMFRDNLLFPLSGSSSPRRILQRLPDLWKQHRQIAPKLRYGITIPRCEKSQNSANLIEVVFNCLFVIHSETTPVDHHTESPKGTPLSTVGLQ
jgi:hypothetical protein